MNETDDRLIELLLAWQESMDAGNPLSAALLCRDDPELVADVECEIARLQAFDRFIFPRANRDAREMSDTPNPAGRTGRFPTLHGYEILEEIGRGGMGVVYKARQQSLGRFVAIKTMAGSRWSQPEFVARLRLEAKGLSLLNDPHIVQVIDVVETPDAISLVLEYVAGGNLARRLNGMPLSPIDAAHFGLTLAETLTVVHARGLLHRDIKPSNILINTTGELKIADFGLMKEAGNSDGLTVTGEPFGSPSYMAPEQAEGRLADVDVRTDVYGIGATLYEMLTGRAPFVGVSTIDTLNQVRQRDPVSLRLLNPGTPHDLETICLKCLEKEPSRRYGTAEQLGDELRRFLQGIPIRSRPIGLFDRCARWCKRRPALGGLVGLSAAAAIVIVALLASNNRNLTNFNQDLTRLNEDLVQSAAHAKRMQHIAEEHERQAKDGLYASDIRNAWAALKDEDTREVTKLLDRQIPSQGESDRRGFEWWYLHRQVHLAPRVLLDIGTPVYFLIYSPDQQLMAAAGRDAVVRLFDPESGKVSMEIPTGQLEVNGVAFSPDGRELATAGDDGTIRVWNLDSRHERLRFTAHPGKAFQLVYASNGSQIISCGDDPVIRAFDSASGQEVYALEGHLKDVQSLVLDPDGQTLVSTSNDGTATVWDLEARRAESVFETSVTAGPVVYLKKQGLLFVGNESGMLQTIDTLKNREVTVVKHLDRMGSLALHPDGSLLAAGDASGQIRLRKIAPDGNFVEEPFQPWQAHRGNVHSLVWATDGTRLFSAGDDGRVTSWNLAAQPDTPKHFSIEWKSFDFCLVPKTECLICNAAPDGSLIRWNWKTGTPLTCGSKELLFDTSASFDGKFFTAFCFDVATANTEELRLFAIPSNVDLPVDVNFLAKWRQAGTLRNARFAPDSRSIAVSRFDSSAGEEAEDSSIWLLSLPDFERIERVPVPHAKVADFSPNGEQLAIAVQSGLVLWDISKKRILWEALQQFTNHLAFSPDGTLIVTAGDQRLVTVRNASDGAIRFQMTSHRAAIVSIAFCLDGRTLATAAADGAIKLWHVATGQELIEFQHPGKIVRHVEFADDGRHLICQLRHGSHDATEVPNEIQIYDGSEIDP